MDGFPRRKFFCFPCLQYVGIAVEDDKLGQGGNCQEKGRNPPYFSQIFRLILSERVPNISPQLFITSIITQIWFKIQIEPTHYPTLSPITTQKTPHSPFLSKSELALRTNSPSLTESKSISPVTFHHHLKIWKGKEGQTLEEPHHEEVAEEEDNETPLYNTAEEESIEKAPESAPAKNKRKSTTTTP